MHTGKDYGSRGTGTSRVAVDSKQAPAVTSAMRMTTRSVPLPIQRQSPSGVSGATATPIGSFIATYALLPLTDSSHSPAAVDLNAPHDGEKTPAKVSLRGSINPPVNPNHGKAALSQPAGNTMSETALAVAKMDMDDAKQSAAAALHTPNHAAVVEDKKEDDNKLKSSAVCDVYTEFLARSKLYDERGIIADSAASLPHYVYRQTLLVDEDFVWNTAWPLTFLGGLGHDIIEYCAQPHARYTTNLSKIFQGLMFAEPHNYWRTGETNQLTFTNHFGSDLVGTVQYWVVPGITLGYPILNRATQAIYQRYVSPLQLSEDEIESILDPKQLENTQKQESSSNKPKKIITKTFQQKILDILNSKNNFNFFRYEIKRIVFTIRFDPRLSLGQREELTQLLIALANSHNYWTRRESIDGLSQIMRGFNETGLVDNLSNFEKYEAHLTPQQFEEKILTLVQNAEAEVIKQSATSFSAKHALWSQGKNQHSAWSLIFWPVFLWQQYSKIRLVEVVLQKIRSAIQYFEAKRQCERDNKEWHYRPEIADYDCSVCPEWNIYFKDTYTSQGCLDGLFAQKRALEDILEKLNPENSNVLLHAFTRIDLSQQDIAVWLDTDFAELLKKIINSGITQLDTLDLSASTTASLWRQDNKVQAIADFLKQMPVKKFIMHNQGIGPEQLRTVWQGMQNRTFDAIEVPGNAAGDEMAATMGDDIANLRVNVTSLNLGNNSITDDGLTRFTPALQNPLLEDIDVNTNLFGDPGCVSSSTQMSSAKSNVRKLIFDSNPLTEVCFSSLGPAVAATPSLQVLSTANCNVDDNGVQAFAPSISVAQLTEWNIGSNQFSDIGFATTIFYAQGSPLHKIIANDNAISDAGLGAALPYFPYTNITSLILDGTQVSATGLKPLIQIAPNTSLVELCLARNNLGNSEFVPWCFEFLANNTHSIRYIDLSANGLLDVDGIPMAENLDQSGITHLILKDNPFTGATGFAFSESFAAGNKLLLFDVSRCGFSGDSLQEIFTYIPGSELRQGYFGGMPIDNADAFKKFISTLPQDQLGQRPQGIDFRRALAKTTPTTQLNDFDVSFADLNTQDLQVICDVWRQTPNPMGNLNLQGNNFDQNQINIFTCQTSSATQVKPWTSYLFNAIPYFVAQQLPQMTQKLWGSITSAAQKALPVAETATAAATSLLPADNNSQNKLATHLILMGLAIFFAYIVYRLLVRTNSMVKSPHLFLAANKECLPLVSNDSDDIHALVATFKHS